MFLKYDFFHVLWTIPIIPSHTGTDAYITLPGLSVSGDLDIEFMLKTSEKDGLIFFSRVRSHSYTLLYFQDQIFLQ